MFDNIQQLECIDHASTTRSALRELDEVVAMNNFRVTVARRIGPVVAGAALALAAVTNAARAYDYGEGDGSNPLCEVIECLDGARECAKAQGTFQLWQWMPVFPYMFSTQLSISFMCYEAQVR